MRPTQPTLVRRLRPWLWPSAAVIASLGLSALPAGVKQGMAWGLERSVFLPYRFALGWGPRSLLAEFRGREELERLARRERLDEEALEATRENHRLRALLGFRRRGECGLEPATVVGQGRARFGDLLLVEPEREPGDPVGMVVLTADGLIGRVASRTGRILRVECLTNANVAVSVLNQRSREGGILKWDPVEGGAAVEGVPAQSDWQAGDRVVTSGLGTAFPRGILVGWVGDPRGGGGGLQNVPVRFAASPARAQEVFLLRIQPEAEAAEQPILSRFYPTEPAGGPRADGGRGEPGTSLATAPAH